jgi:hypothetical protein
MRGLLCTRRAPGTIHACNASSPKKSICASALKLILPPTETRSNVNFPICSASSARASWDRRRWVREQTAQMRQAPYGECL